MKAAGSAHRLAHVARFHLGHEVEDELRHLRAFAPPELTTVQCGLTVRIGDGELTEIFAFLGAVGQVLGLLADVIELLRGGRRRQRQQDMRHVEFVVGRRILLPLQVLVQFMRRHGDVSDDVSLPKRAQGQLFAHGLAILLVVHALGFERRGQLIERDLVALGDFLQRTIQLFVGNGEPHPLGSLRLNFLQNQSIEHLLPKDALGRQLDFLFLQAFGHRIHLRVQLALQDQAVVDHGGDAVEHFAVDADIARLRMQHTRGGQHGQKTDHGSPGSGKPWPRRRGRGPTCHGLARGHSRSLWDGTVRVVGLGSADRISGDLFLQVRVRSLSDRTQAGQFQL